MADIGPQPPIVKLKAKGPDEALNYTFNIQFPLATLDANGCEQFATVKSATFATQPSGAAEMLPTALALAGNALTVNLTLGVPGRDYTHRLIVQFNETTEIAEQYLAQYCTPVLAQAPLPPDPESTDFCAPVST